MHSNYRNLNPPNINDLYTAFSSEKVPVSNDDVFPSVGRPQKNFIRLP